MPAIDTRNGQISVSEFASQIGKLGGAARAKSLSKQRLSQIGRMGARAKKVRRDLALQRSEEEMGVHEALTAGVVG